VDKTRLPHVMISTGNRRVGLIITVTIFEASGSPQVFAKKSRLADYASDLSAFDKLLRCGLAASYAPSPRIVSFLPHAGGTVGPRREGGGYQEPRCRCLFPPLVKHPARETVRLQKMRHTNMLLRVWSWTRMGNRTSTRSRLPRISD